VSQLGQRGTAIDKIVYGKKFHVTEWLEDAYMEICRRPRPITEEEGERMGMTDVVKIAEIRENFLKMPVGTGGSDEYRRGTIRSAFLLAPQAANPVERIDSISKGGLTAESESENEVCDDF
jgi:hypothetical protein